MNRKKEAIEEYEKYIKKTNVQVTRDIMKIKMAEILIDLKENEKALDIYLQVLEDSPYSKELCKNRISFLEWEISKKHEEIKTKT